MPSREKNVTRETRSSGVSLSFLDRILEICFSVMSL